MSETLQTNYLPAFDVDLDARGLTCPLPILRTKKMLAQMQSGQVLRVTTTDRDAMRDFQAFTRQTGNSLLAQQQVGSEIRHFLRRR
jgi:tRNA 2-thiouridine synthesizing protein A